MFKDPLRWFPNQWFKNVLGILFLLVFLLDAIIPRLFNKRSSQPAQRGDRGSFWLIYLASLIALSCGLWLRIKNIGTLSGLLQYFGLACMAAGTIIRNWALIVLGQFFSRTVQISADHQLITSGPYRWIRHPAYTGMLLVNSGLVFAIGTWLGGLIAFGIMLAATLYRIQIEEHLLLASFGDRYREYIKSTWKLIPGW